MDVDGASNGSVSEGHPLAPPKLNLDILLAIRSQCERKEVSSLMRTCWAMYQGGARLVLGEPVFLSHKRALLSLCRFLLAEDDTRFPYLHELTLSFGNLSKRGGKGLAVILQDATELKSLTLLDIDGLLERSKDLANVIVGLQSLQSFKMDNGTCQLAFNMIRSMQAPLRSVEFSYGEDKEECEPFLDLLEPDDAADYHPVVLCAAFAPTLERMDVSCRHNIEEFGPPDGVPITVYPKMRDLLLADEQPYLKPYVDAFPNLKTLTVSQPLDYDVEDRMERLPQWGATRAINREDQLLLGTWGHLEELGGYLVSLFCLGLTCTVSRLYVAMVHAEELDMLACVLDDVRPTELDMRVWGDLFGEEESDLPDILRQPGCAALKKLSLEISIPKAYKNCDVVQSMNALLESLTSLEALETLKLSVNELYLNPTPSRYLMDLDGSETSRREASDSPAPLCPAEESMMAFNPSEYSRRAFESIPTLKEVVCQVKGPRELGRIIRQMRSSEGEVVETEPPPRWF